MQIIDEFTGRIMADRSWRHGLHQAIEIKEGVPVTADKENLAPPELPAIFPPVPDHGRDDRNGMGSGRGAVADLPAAGRADSHEQAVHPRAIADADVRHDGGKIRRGRASASAN